MNSIAKLKLILVTLLILGVSIAATIGAIYIDETGIEFTSLPDMASPDSEDSISAAELEDLQAVATQTGISLREAIDRYAWNNDFAIHVAVVRQIAPESFAGAEIVSVGKAWIAFAGSAPETALNELKAFSDSHDSVSVQVRTDKGFTEVELQEAIEAAHFAVLEKPEVNDANTGFDFATGEIRSLVVLQKTASDIILDDLQVSVNMAITDATREDILNSISFSVVQSGYQLVWGYRDKGYEHLGGEPVNSCTSGFGTKDSEGVRGISTAGHCKNSQSDDGASLTFRAEYQGVHGDFQWHVGSHTHNNEFYSGSASATEVNRRKVLSIGFPIVGQMLCRNGVTTHKNCQQVRKLHYCMADICNLVQMKSDLTEKGDSGGPVYWETTAYGLLSGTVVDPWPFTREVFSRADRLHDALGVSIATD